MTHAELTSACYRPGSGLLPSGCAGELALSGTFPDRCFALGALREREVKVWKCPRCEMMLSESEGRLLNAYRAPLPPDVILGLAASRPVDRPAPAR